MWWISVRKAEGERRGKKTWSRRTGRRARKPAAPAVVRVYPV
jgi:hypothetical protein